MNFGFLLKFGGTAISIHHFENNPDDEQYDQLVNELITIWSFKNW